MVEEETVEAIRRVLQTYPDISFAYVHGSRTRGTAHEESDIDIAMVTSGTLSTRDLSRIALDIEDVTSTEVDVGVLDEAGVIFQHQVLEHGQLVYVADESARIRFEETVYRRYHDYKPFFEEYNRVRRATTE